MPTINPVTIRAHWICFFPKTSASTEVIFSAAPLSATSLPSMAPRQIMITRDPRVSQIPFCTERLTWFKGMPIARPVIIETIRKAMNAFTFPHVIRRISAMMQTNIISNVMLPELYCFYRLNSFHDQRRDQQHEKTNNECKDIYQQYMPPYEVNSGFRNIIS